MSKRNYVISAREPIGGDRSPRRQRGKEAIVTKPDGHKRTRLVAKGFSQVEGIDFDQVFSPVVRCETVCLMLALASIKNWHIEELDV